jgi:segregation and condensation protein B
MSDGELTKGVTEDADPSQDDALQIDQKADHSAVIEAILFSSDSPISPKRLSSLIESVDIRTVRRCVAALNKAYDDRNAAFRIEEIAGGFQMLTLPEFEPWIRAMRKTKSETKLSAASLESLAIVAYKQPITRAAIESIRGVGCGEVLRTLMERGLVKIVGFAEELGRPRLYGTTSRFLDIFGLRDLSELPKVSELTVPE